MAEQDVQEILLKVRSDRGSITSALRDIASVKSGIGALNNTNVNSLQTRIDNFTKEFADLRAEITATAEEIDNLDSKSIPTQATGGGFAGKRAGEGISNIASIAGQIGGAEAAAPIRLIGEVAKVTEVLPQLTTEISKLGVEGVAVAAVIGIAALAVGELTKQGNEVTAGIRAVISREKEYYQLRVQGTTDSINAAIKQAEFEQKLAQARADDLAGVPQAYKETADQLGVFTGAVIELGGALNVGGLGTVRDSKVAYEQANAELVKANEKLALYNGLLDDTTTALNNAAEAQKAMTNEFIANSKEAADRQVELAKFERTAGTAQVTERIAANEERLKGLEQEATALLSVADSSAEAKARLFEIQSETNKLTAENSLLNGSIGESIKLREDAKKAEDEQNKIRQDSVSAWKKYTDDVTKLNEAEQKALADLEQKYADTKVAIAKQAATAAENALNKLTESRASLALNLARADADAQTQRQQDTLNAQIDFARDEARAARDHANDLLDIRRRAAESEEDLIAKRDFAGLFRSRRNTNNQIDDANRQYARQRADRLEAFAQEADDRNRQFIFEQQQRQVKYARDLADAQVQYSKELQQSRLAKNRALLDAAASYARDQQLLYNKYQAERSARISSINSELQLIAQGNAGKLALEKQYYDQLTLFLKSQLATVGVGSNNFSGASSPGGTQINYSPSINITSGADAAQVGKIVEQKTAAYFNALVK